MRRIECFHSASPTLPDRAAEQVSAWQQDRKEWRGQQPVTAALAEPLEIVALNTPWLTTATTDGRRIAFNPAWSAGLEALERRQMQEHLVWHAAAADYRTNGSKEPYRWHLACDHAINAQLLQLGAELPHDAVLFPRAVMWRRSEVYAWLSQHPWLEMEKPRGQLYGQPASCGEMSALEAQWQQQITSTVQRFLGTPWLPDTVAAWLLGRR